MKHLNSSKKYNMRINCARIISLILFSCLLLSVLPGCETPGSDGNVTSPGGIIITPGNKTNVTDNEFTPAPTGEGTADNTAPHTGTADHTPDSATDRTADNKTTATPTVTARNTDPNLPLSGLIICVDPGHQGTAISEKEPAAPWGPEANSSVNNTVMKAKATAGTTGISTKKTEYEVNLEISLKLRDALKAKGATVIMTRTDNSSKISNMERALLANENNCIITFNIHCNGSDNQSISGIELYVRGAGDNTSEYAARSKNEAALGQKLLDRLASYTGAKKRNVNKSDAYTGINWRDHITFIIECGFMSNPEEDVNLSTPSYQDKLVRAIVDFVSEDFKG